MKNKTIDVLKERLSGRDYAKLTRLKNQTLHDFVAKYIELCNPDKVFVSDDAAEDIQYIREEALRSGEEKRLAIEGHTFHVDGYYDQARDPKNTKFLAPKGIDLGRHINAIDKEEGLKELYDIMKDVMKGHTMFVCFFCLGPVNSEFSMPCLQITDSSYVVHNENVLYRAGYREFMRLGNSPAFFKFIHSEGELENCVSKNIDKRRVYIDTGEDVVYSVNTQYGGNTIGHKKLAMRLAISRASEEGNWLTEHMFLMGVHGPGGRKTYFTGAYPSLCGKTTTSLIKGETIVGDDIVYLRKKAGEVHAVNVEKGMFGIIDGVNSKDEPQIYSVLTKKGEIIFSNVLMIGGGEVYWVGKDGPMPESGFNHSGQWHSGKKDKEGNEIPASHKNARFTVSLAAFDNLDSESDNPAGVLVGGIVYGGRDSDTLVPVEESFGWVHGIITKGASLESETTAATLGKEGVRKFNPMANLEFLSIPIGRYISDNLAFGNSLRKAPKIFSANYFLRDKNGKFLNDKNDKRVWLKWMELRVHNDIGAIKTPTGNIPSYDSLRQLFKNILSKDYSEEAYTTQFMVRIPENLAKIDRIINTYTTQVPDAPAILFETLEEQRKRLIEAKQQYGDYIPPKSFEKNQK